MGRTQKPLIITFMGPVGVGKSAQIQLLKEHLQSKDVKVSATYLKSSHALSHIVWKALIVLGACETVHYTEGSRRIYPRKEVMRRLFLLWRLLDSFSISLKFFFMVYMPYKLGFTLLIEEGLAMTIYTYVESLPRFFNVEPKALKLPACLLEWAEGQHHLNIILDASNKELDIRRKNRSFRREELNEFITMQRKWMQSLDLHDTISIETSDKPLSTIHKSIIDIVDRRMEIA